MSIYLAARQQMVRRKRARTYKQSLALLSFAVTTLAILAVVPSHFNDDQKNATLPPVELATVASKAKTLAGYDAMFSQDVFDSKSVEFEFGESAGPSALDISKSLGAVRFAMLEARTNIPKKLQIDTVRVAAISPELANQSRIERAERSFGALSQEMPSVAALDAINALGGDEEARDPSLPYPLAVPTKLAYARANDAPTLKDFQLTQASMIASKKQHWCLATAVYFEARGESYRGQVAVAQVVRNRVKHSAYPSTICGVVFQNQSWRNRCQFSFACDGVPERVNEKTAWKQAEEIATKVIKGDIYLPEVANATHYHANYVWPKWAPKLKKLTKIGVHIFYRFRNG